MLLLTCSTAECECSVCLPVCAQAGAVAAHPPKSLCSPRALATAPETTARRQATGWMVEEEEEEQGSAVMGSKRCSEAR